MELFYILLILLIVTRMGGELALRLGQPALIDNLVAGISLGMVVKRFGGSFPVLSELAANPVFTGIIDPAMFFLMLLALVFMAIASKFVGAGLPALWVGLDRRMR